MTGAVERRSRFKLANLHLSASSAAAVGMLISLIYALSFGALARRLSTRLPDKDRLLAAYVE